MSPTEFIWSKLRAVRWGESCPRGAPVPEPHRCAALNCDSVRLTALTAGQRASVTCLDDPGSGAAAKLAALGVLPGVSLQLMRTSPVFVFRIDYSTFAVDASLAVHIRVRTGDLDAGAGADAGADAQLRKESAQGKAQ